MKGLIAVNKPKGVSSSSIVVKIKKILNTKKVGHMGTLDPLASGVLVVGVGKATRLFQEFLNKKKRYLATFKFGEQTDTLDLEGEVVKTSNVIPTKEEILNILKSFIGKQNQMPPEFSSKKINGKRAYDLIRSGKEVNLTPSEITIYDISLTNQIDEKTFVFDIICSSGTYIRSIARDMGERLNSCATMTDLIRTESGNIKLEDCVKLEEQTKETLEENIISLSKALNNFKSIEISKELLVDLLNGKKVSFDRLVKTEKISAKEKFVLVNKNEIVGICFFDENCFIKIDTFLYN